MSKTKEFILRHNASVPTPQLEGVYQAMDEYALQSVEEYKDKLKKEIRRVVASEGIGKYTINKAIEIIETL